jgi:hypothetical protein
MRRLIFAVLVAVTACSPSAETTGDVGVTTTSTVLTTTTEAMTPAMAAGAFAECMAEQGIDVGEIPLDVQGRPLLGAVTEVLDTADPAVRGALASCASLLTASGALDLLADPEVSALVVEQLGMFAECMRAEGVDEFPDPDPGFSGTSSPFPPELIPFNAPGFGEAMLACQQLIGTLGLGG